jgi:hypothetical protein
MSFLKRHGQSFPAWREGHPACVDKKGKAFKGRNCARKMSTPFRYMEADLYNLQPAIGEVNWLRSNYSMAMIPGEKREFGACDLTIANRKIQPRQRFEGTLSGHTCIWTGHILDMGSSLGASCAGERPLVPCAHTDQASAPRPIRRRGCRVRARRAERPLPVPSSRGADRRLLALGAPGPGEERPRQCGRLYPPVLTSMHLSPRLDRV